MKKRVFWRVGALILAVALLAGFIGGIMYGARIKFTNAGARTIGATSARGMCTMDVETGRVLFSRNPDATMGMASTTKIVTALTVLETVSDIDTPIAIDDKAVGIEGSSIYLRRGEQLTIRELLYGLMLRSGNDAAVALALAVSPTVADFAALMNRTAVKYGAANSNFTNPHGLDGKDHYTTARDLAALTSAALKNPTFAEIVSTTQKRISGLDMPRVLYNKNKLLKSLPGCIGVKTGFTKKTGRCFVGAREINGQKIVCVVLNCGPMFEESAQLMKDAAEIFPNRQILTPDEIFTATDGKTAVALEPFRYPLSESELSSLEIKIENDTVSIRLNGSLLHESPCVPIAG